MSNNDLFSVADTSVAIKIEPEVEVVRQLLDLESHFSTMLTDLRKFGDSCDLARMQFFLGDLLETEKFRQCSTFDEILLQLRQGHVDTFNTYCLEQLAAHLSDHTHRTEVCKLINEYNKKKEEFLEETVVTEFHRAVRSSVQPVYPGKTAVIKIKIPQSLANNRTLKDMERLADKAFGEYRNSFVSLHTVPGSIVVTWFFPNSLAGALEQLAQANITVFKREGVLEVSVAGSVVFPQKDSEVCN